VNNKTKMKRLMQDVVKVLTGLPQDEGVLVFVYKERFNRNPKRVLEIEYEKATGVDLTNKDEAPKLSTGQPRISIETWGNETSLNSYSFCKHVVLVGILHRDLSELEAQHLGQINNLTKMVDPGDLQAIALSERAHCAYQAFSRGACRIMAGQGQAQSMTGYVIEHEDGLETELNKVMPGVQWKTWEPTYADSVAHGKLVLDLSSRISKHLRALPETVQELSGRRLRADLRAGCVNRDTWSRAIRKTLAENHQWIQQGQSYRRAS